MKMKKDNLMDTNQVFQSLTTVQNRSNLSFRLVTYVVAILLLFSGGCKQNNLAKEFVICELDSSNQVVKVLDPKKFKNPTSFNMKFDSVQVRMYEDNYYLIRYGKAVDGDGYDLLYDTLYLIGGRELSLFPENFSSTGPENTRLERGTGRCHSGCHPSACMWIICSGCGGGCRGGRPVFESARDIVSN